MDAAGSIKEFLAAPLGRYLVGRSYLVWCASPTFCGSTHWGERSEEDARQLLSLYVMRNHPSLTPPFDRVIDGSALEHIGAAAFEALFGPLRPQLEELRGFVRRQAVVVRPDFSGATLAAMLPPLGPTDDYRVFHDSLAAFKYADAGHGPTVWAEVEAIVARQRQVPELLYTLGDYLRSDLVHASLRRAARNLGLSERSIQRQLQELRTTFREQLLAARVGLARSLLADGDAKVEAVARQVGCSSASQLGLIFKRAGQPPPARLRGDLARSR